MKRGAELVMLTPPAKRQAKRSYIPRSVGSGFYSYKMKPSGRYLARISGLNRRGVASRETGYVDLAQTTFANDTTGTIALVATIPQGASVSQRVGKKVILKSIQIRGQWVAGSAGIVSDCAMLLVYDKRPTGSLPSITDVLVTANAGSFNNDANSGRFQIVRRWDWQAVGNSTTPTTGKESGAFDHYVNLKGRPCVFKAAGTGAIGDIEEGALYMIGVGSQAAGTAAGSTICGMRTRFLDV